MRSIGAPDLDRLWASVQASTHARQLSLRGADLTDAVLGRARLTECDLSRAELERCVLDEAVVRMCKLDGVHGAQLHAATARIEDCSAVGADLSGADLRGAQLTETSFVRAILRAAMLDGATGDGTSFRGADLAAATLVDARLAEADFRGADLTGADLSGGHFVDADFRGAILDGVTWTGVECAGAEFDVGANPTAVGRRPAAVGATPADQALVEGALAKAAADALADPDRPAEVRELARTLERAIAEQRIDAASLFGALEPIMRVLDEAPDDEPPEAWRAWLEGLIEGRSP